MSNPKYPISNINYNDIFDENYTPKIKKKRAKDPVFYGFYKESTDRFWRKIYSGCSRGNFPEGYTYSDGILHYKKKSLKIEDLESCNKFFNKTGLLSPTDEKIIKERKERQEISLVWSKLSFQMKKRLIYQFTEEMKNLHNLSKCAEKKLRSDLLSIYHRGGFNKNVVQIKNRTINTINGLEIYPDGTLYFPPFVERKSKKNEEIKYDDIQKYPKFNKKWKIIIKKSVKKSKRYTEDSSDVTTT